VFLDQPDGLTLDGNVHRGRYELVHDDGVCRTSVESTWQECQQQVAGKGAAIWACPGVQGLPTVQRAVVPEAIPVDGLGSWHMIQHQPLDRVRMGRFSGQFQQRLVEENPGIGGTGFNYRTAVWQWGLP